jgi:hypothetical protein
MHDKVAREMGCAGHDVRDRVSVVLVARLTGAKERIESLHALGVLVDRVVCASAS